MSNEDLFFLVTIGYVIILIACLYALAQLQDEVMVNRAYGLSNDRMPDDTWITICSFIPGVQIIILVVVLPILWWWVLKDDHPN